MASGARNKLGALMFKPKVFWDEMYCIEEKTCDFSAAPSDSAPRTLCPPRYGPGVTLRNKVHSCEVSRAPNVEPLLRIERSQLRHFGHISNPDVTN